MSHNEIVIELGNVVDPARHGYDVDAEKSNQRFVEVLGERLKVRHPLVRFSIRWSAHRHGYAVTSTPVFMDANAHVGHDPDITPVIDQLVLDPVAWLVRK